MHGFGPLPPADPIQACLRPRCLELTKLSDDLILDLRARLDLRDATILSQADELFRMAATVGQAEERVKASPVYLAGQHALQCWVDIGCPLCDSIEGPHEHDHEEWCPLAPLNNATEAELTLLAGR